MIPKANEIGSMARKREKDGLYYLYHHKAYYVVVSWTLVSLSFAEWDMYNGEYEQCRCDKYNLIVQKADM